MPVYEVGDLVQPKNDPFIEEENPNAVGIIVELRSMTGKPPEAKVLWNDMIERGPKWTFIMDIRPIEKPK